MICVCIHQAPARFSNALCSAEHVGIGSTCIHEGSPEEAQCIWGVPERAARNSS